ncbi:MAG: histidine phosphatase family protein [Acidimicrobiia bacterium]
MAKVHLVRHGEVHNPDHVVYASLPGFGLNERGRTQAKEVARYLRNAPVTAVWSSPLQRAIETAEPIARAHDLPIRIAEDLIEWKMADDWAGIPWDGLASERPGQLEAYLTDPLNMPFASEPLTALAARMRSALARIADGHDGDVVVVSHQDPVQAARLALAGRDLRTQHTNKPQHGTVITMRPGTPWVELAAWTPAQADETAPSVSDRGVDSEAGTEQFGVGVEGQRR